MSGYFGVYQVRLPMENIWNESINIKRREFYSVIYDQCIISRKIFSNQNIITTDKFIGMNIMGKDSNVVNFKKCLEEDTNHDISIEYMCHPVILS